MSIEQLRAIYLVKVGFIILSILAGCNSQSSIARQEKESFVFSNHSEKIVFLKGEYITRIKDSLRIQVTFKDSAKLLALSKMRDVVLVFFIGEEKHVAKGNFLTYSGLPKGCDYFFVLGLDSLILLSREEHTIMLNKISNWDKSKGFY